MRNLGLIAIGVCLAAAESLLDAVLPFQQLAPDIVLPFVLYMGIAGYNVARGAAVAFVVGYFVDAFHAGAPMCLNMFVLVSLFLLSRLLMARLRLAGTVFHLLLAFLGSLASSLIIIGLRAIFERQVGDLEPLATVALTRASATAVIAPFVFTLVRRFDAGRVQRREERGIR